MSESPRLEELRRRVQGDPASIAFAALAEEYRRAGRFRDAVETSRSGLRHHPTYVSARVTLGRSLVELQELDQAERELAFVLRSAPDNLAARRALGELCWQRLRFADALIHFQAAQALAPKDPDLPGVIASLERELASERAAAEAATVTAPAEAEVDTAAAAAAEVPAVEVPAVNGSTPGARMLASLERFYRTIVRSRETQQQDHAHL
jgi:tetratricopeptide (TPR) repeat protein